MMAVTSIVLCFAAFCALSLSMRRHHAQAFGPSIHNKRFIWRAVGWSLLAVSLALSIQESGMGIGLVKWCGALALAGAFVAWLLPYRPRWLIPITGITIALSLFAWIAISK